MKNFFIENFSEDEIVEIFFEMIAVQMTCEFVWKILRKRSFSSLQTFLLQAFIVEVADHGGNLSVYKLMVELENNVLEKTNFC